MKRKPVVANSLSATARPTLSWGPVFYFYCAYFCILLLGGIIGIYTAAYGAALFLTLLYGRYGFFLLRTRLDLLRFSILLSLLIPIIPMVSFDLRTLLATLQELIKYQALHLVILLGATLPLSPLSKDPRKRVLYLTILFFLICGCLWQILKDSEVTRFRGFLPNPNGFALTAMMLLLLTDTEAFRVFTQKAGLLLCLSFILLSQTSGALLGFFVGLVHLNIVSGVTKRLRSLVLLGTAIALLVTLICFLPQGLVRPVDATLEKFSVVKENLNRVISGEKIDYYNIIEKSGQDMTSGLWRLSQWQQILSLLFNSTAGYLLFGYGIGTTDVIFNLKAHNDYLRLLFETGFVGFFFNLMVWIILYHRMSVKYRWAALMFAVFCFTENNYDHFPAMSLLAFYMLSAKDSINRGSMVL
jgi:hypothetical protein